MAWHPLPAMHPPTKRALSEDDDDDDRDSLGTRDASQPPAKRPRAITYDDSEDGRLISERTSTSQPPPEAIFRLSDELLVRILSHFNERELIDVAPTSRRLHNLASDSHLWRPLYYRRFVLPRAHLIPGFRTTNYQRKAYKLHFGEGREVWADGGAGRSGGLVVPQQPRSDASSLTPNLAQTVDWKKSYKQWHNWERGRCSVDELPLHDIPFRRTFAKFVNGHAVTADVISGLRVWDLRTRELIAQMDLRVGEDRVAEPTCVTVDGQGLALGVLGISVGLDDGTFGVWKLNVEERVLRMVCRHTVKRVGSLVALAYLHPYVVAATSAHLVVVYTLEHPVSESSIEETLAMAGNATDFSTNPNPSLRNEAAGNGGNVNKDHLIVPYLLLTFNGRNTMPPRALSIRKTPSAVVASIAYTFNTYGGWCIGVQDFDIKANGVSKPQVVMSRTASTPPKSTPSKSRWATASFEGSALRTWWPRNDNAVGHESNDAEVDEDDDANHYSPVSLCYSHPYLLATMPDNTMMLHLCTSTPTSLSISSGTRLYGHTSAISDAAITPWGKAVSVSSRGNDIRLWKLEGGFDGQSVSLQPRRTDGESLEREQPQDLGHHHAISKSAVPKVRSGVGVSADLDDRRNWVGFDDERVVVLKESRTGKESFMVYDFT